MNAIEAKMTISITCNNCGKANNIIPDLSSFGYSNEFLNDHLYFEFKCFFCDHEEDIDFK